MRKPMRKPIQDGGANGDANPHVLNGKKGGKIGGKKRAESMTAEERKEGAARAARARWGSLTTPGIADVPRGTL